MEPSENEQVELHEINYLILMQDEGLTHKDLPENAKVRIKTFNLLKGNFNKNPNEKIKNSLIKMDVEICDMIQNFLEEEIEDEDENQKQINMKTKEEEDKVVADKVAADKVVADKVAADKVAAEKVAADKVAADKVAADKVAAEKVAADKVATDKAVEEENIFDFLN